MIALNETIFKLGIPVSMYADDGYFYTDDDNFKLPDRELAMGVRFAKEKCGFVKRKGL